MMDDDNKKIKVEGGRGESDESEKGVDPAANSESKDKRAADGKGTGHDRPAKAAKIVKRDGGTKASKAPSKGTYPKPKNFAERMMNVLENEVDTDIIDWYGEEDLISINTKALKLSEILDDRFQGIRYAAFIRNLSRWGFRKVPKMDITDGVVIYRNSLFQRENPHLVRHMKIDSDVQDIFGQHQRKAAKQESQPQPQRERSTGPLHQQAQHQQPAGPHMQDSSLTLLTQLISQPSQQQNPQPGNLSMAAQLSNALAQQRGGSRSANDILGEILSLARQYLEVAPVADGPTVESIKSLLRLLSGLGTDQLQSREAESATQPAQQLQQQALPSNATPLLQELLLSVGQGQAQATNQQQHQQPTQGSLIEMIQQQAARHQQQQQQRERPQANLESLLSQATGASSLGGLPLNPQLLMQLQQQQQQQQQNNSQNQPSPPGNSCPQS